MKTVAISSALRNLPDHLSAVKDACLRTSMQPMSLDTVGAKDQSSEVVSRTLLDQADIYLAVFGHIYEELAEHEFRYAVQQDVPTLVFVMSDDHAGFTKRELERAMLNARKLKALIKRATSERFSVEFTSASHLRTLVIQSLATLDESSGDLGVGSRLSHIRDIPIAPKPYVAHPYTLLQTKGLIGRREELEHPTNWVTHPDEFDLASIMCIVAVGGLGKSALTWEWFDRIAPQEIDSLAGRIWWSFYQAHSDIEEFIAHSVAYVSGKSLEQVSQTPFTDQERQLLRALDESPYVVVLDGLERILTAYSRLDAAYIDHSSDGIGDAGAPRNRLRKATKLRTAHFLQKLARVRSSKILISSRLQLADLEDPLGKPIPGVSLLILEGLSDADAIDLWRAYRATGSRDTMLPMFKTFDSHPLLIQLLASEVADFRDKPGDFDAWRSAKPDFDPFVKLPLVNVRSHILDFALRGLSPRELEILHVIAGFRMPATFGTLKALLLQSDRSAEPSEKSQARALEDLDCALTSLENRGLLGWDRSANRYDLHPIVRGVIWSRLNSTVKQDVYSRMRVHFEAIPVVPPDQVDAFEQLDSGVELFNALLGLQRFDDAFAVWRDRLEHATVYRLSASLQRRELVEGLFPRGIDAPPALSHRADQGFALNALALAYSESGQPRIATRLFQRAAPLLADDILSSIVNRADLSNSRRLCGELFGAELTVRKSAIDVFALDESDSLVRNFYSIMVMCFLARVLTIRGEWLHAKKLLSRTEEQCHRISNDERGGNRPIWLRGWDSVPNRQCQVYTYCAECAMWMHQYEDAERMTTEALALYPIQPREHDYIRALYLHGLAVLMSGQDSRDALTEMEQALARARNCELVEEQLPILVALAEIHRQRQDFRRSRELLDEFWEPAKQGPYPLFLADALILMSAIHRAEGETKKAVESALDAYRHSWCDGPPFAYHAGLTKAKDHLQQLDAAIPHLEQFAESRLAELQKVPFQVDDLISNLAD